MSSYPVPDSDAAHKRYDGISQRGLFNVQKGQAVQQQHKVLRQHLTRLLEQGAPVEAGALSVRISLAPRPWSLTAIEHLVSHEEFRRLYDKAPTVTHKILHVYGQISTVTTTERTNVRKPGNQRKIRQADLEEYLNQVDKCRELCKLRRHVLMLYESGAQLEAGPLEMEVSTRRLRTITPRVVRDILGRPRCSQLVESLAPLRKRRLVITKHNGNHLGWHAR